MPGAVFVTVGTTKFDALIQAVDTIEVADALVKQGYTALVIQKGAGRYQVQTLVPLGKQHHQHSNGLQVQVFEFAPSLAEYMKQADLIISHSGSGSIFEALRLGKPLVAVPNAILMDNHQAELAEHLAHLKYIITARPDTLVHTLQHLSIDGLKPYESGDAKGVISHIDILVAKKPSSKVPFVAVACLIAVLLVAMLYASVRVLIAGRSDRYSSNV